MTLEEFCEYYPDLLILQYVGKPNAYATVQAWARAVIMALPCVEEVNFSSVATSGSFVLVYDGNSTTSLSWDSTALHVQTALRQLDGLEQVIVTGSITSLQLLVYMWNVPPVALLITATSNTLQDNLTNPVTITTALQEDGSNSETLPLAVQNAFSIETAVGAQLDTLGKYAGVVRTGYGFGGPITLVDSDFRSLIKMAVIQNNSGSSLKTIQENLFNFFNGNVLVVDYKDMTLSYLIDSNVGSIELIQMFVLQGLLPRPMGVRIRSVIYIPTIDNIFAFATYAGGQPNNTHGFNTYSQYDLDAPFLSYADAVVI